MLVNNWLLKLYWENSFENECRVSRWCGGGIVGGSLDFIVSQSTKPWDLRLETLNLDFSKPLRLWIWTFGLTKMAQKGQWSSFQD